MQVHILTGETESERAQLRALIDQQTKEFESKHGAIQTQDIIKKSSDGGAWVKPAVPIVEKKKQLSALNKRVLDEYPKARCTEALAAELGITLEALRGRAKRLGAVRGQDGHPRLLKAARRKDRVRRLMLAGYSVKEIIEKTGLADRTTRYDYSEIKKELEQD